MNTQNTSQQNLAAGISKGALYGAGIALGLSLIAILIFTCSGLHLDYGLASFMPALTMTTAGTVAGALYMVVESIGKGYGIPRKLIIALGVLAFAITMWVSMVAAFAYLGLWN